MPKVLLDAGHFGKYNRSPVYPTYCESVQMWELHLLLKKYLEEYGFEVATARAIQTKDLGVTLRGRKAKGYDLFLSLHSNAVSGNTDARRADVYYAYDNFNNAKVLAKKLADAIGECMGVEGEIKTRKSTLGKWEYYGVLRGARAVNCPLYYILEHSFHTNEQSAKWLMSESNLDKLAKAEAEVIAEYFGMKKKEEAKTEEKKETAKKGVSTVNVELTVLKNGSKGEEVKTLQTLLKAKGFKGKNGKALTIDGIFGANCDYAVEAFQKAKKLTVDGVVGANTWKKLLKG